MSLLLDKPPRPAIPRAGLVCWHDCYDPTTALTTVPDKANKYALGFGAGAAAPSWAASGLGVTFTTDDYCETGAITTSTMAGDWTALVAFNPGSSATGTVWCFGVDDDNDQELWINTAGGVRFKSRGLATNFFADQINTSQVAFQIVAIQNASHTITIQRLDTGSSVSCSDKQPAGAATVSVGARVTGTNPVPSITVLANIKYNCALTSAEIAGIRRKLKAIWLPRGVTIL